MFDRGRTSKAASMDAQKAYSLFSKDKFDDKVYLNYFKYHKPYSKDYLSKELMDAEEKE